jgi:hypothetical protein
MGINESTIFSANKDSQRFKKEASLEHLQDNFCQNFTTFQYGSSTWIEPNQEKSLLAT